MALSEVSPFLWESENDLVVRSLFVHLARIILGKRKSRPKEVGIDTDPTLAHLARQIVTLFDPNLGGRSKWPD
jgi:hypothetical protein